MINGSWTPRNGVAQCDSDCGGEGGPDVGPVTVARTRPQSYHCHPPSRAHPFPPNVLARCAVEHHPDPRPRRDLTP